MTTGALIYFDNGDNEMTNADDNQATSRELYTKDMPKKLLKRGGK